jgi:predicted ATP-binding protein involved in virulence
LQLRPGINILYGQNGAGKTTLIHAICKALSFVMGSESVPMADNPKKMETLSITNGNPKLKVEGYSTRGDFYLDANEDDGRTTQSEITIEAEGSLSGYPLRWAMSAPSRSARLRKSEFMEAFHTFWQWHKETNRLPVLAYYSDGFPHVEDRNSVSEKVASLRNFGYYDWNNEEACSKIWLERMERTLKERERQERRERRGVDWDVKRLDALSHEINEIERCFRIFSKGDSYIEVDSLELGSYDGSLTIRTTQSKFFAFRQLPAGYKRMFYILLDIAYRSYILNHTADAEGIVIIDEIDLHLHPGLEKVVLDRFAKTFPHLQFIISTHSPLVITSMSTDEKKNCIYRMDTTMDREMLGDVYGLDYNSGIEDVMQVAASDEELDRVAETCAYLMSNGMEDRAETLKQGFLSGNKIKRNRLEEKIVQLRKSY